MATIGGDRRITAFLDLIAASEGTSSSPVTKSDGYDIIVSGTEGHNRFNDFSAHPFAGGRQPILVRAARPAEQAKTVKDLGPKGSPAYTKFMNSLRNAHMSGVLSPSGGAGAGQ